MSLILEKPKCPRCGSHNFRKEGIYNERQLYQCKDCKRHFREPKEKVQLPKSNVELRELNCFWCDEVVHVAADIMTTGYVYCRKCYQAMKKGDDGVLSRRFKAIGDANVEVS